MCRNDVNLNEPIAASSVGTDDLTVGGGAGTLTGTVLGAVALDADTARYTIGGITSEGTVTIIRVPHTAEIQLRLAPV